MKQLKRQFPVIAGLLVVATLVVTYWVLAQEVDDGHAHADEPDCHWQFSVADNIEDYNAGHYWNECEASIFYIVGHKAYDITLR